MDMTDTPGAGPDPGVPARRPRAGPPRRARAARVRGRHRGGGRVRARAGGPPRTRRCDRTSPCWTGGCRTATGSRMPRHALQHPTSRPDPHVVRRRRGAVRRDHGRRRRLRAQADPRQRPRRRRAPGRRRGVAARPGRHRAGAVRLAGEEGDRARRAHRPGAADPRPHRRGADQPADRRADVPGREDREELRESVLSKLGCSAAPRPPCSRPSTCRRVDWAPAERVGGAHGRRRRRLSAVLGDLPSGLRVVAGGNAAAPQRGALLYVWTVPLRSTGCLCSTRTPVIPLGP